MQKPSTKITSLFIDGIQGLCFLKNISDMLHYGKFMAMRLTIIIFFLQNRWALMFVFSFVSLLVLHWQLNKFKLNPESIIGCTTLGVNSIEQSFYS